MPAAFVTKIQHQRLAYSPFSSDQMAYLGNFMIRTISDRIAKGVNLQDQPARSLNVGYAKDKIKRGREPIRNWFYSGRTMASLKVKVASEDRVTIGFINNYLTRQITVAQIVAINNKMVPQWGISPEDDRAKIAFVVQMLKQHKAIVTVNVAA